MSPPGERVSSQLYKDRIALDAELEALRAQEHTILRTIALYQQRVENTPRREQEMQILLRNYGTTKERYESLLARQQEAELAESLEQRQQGERFRLLEPATPATTPVEPNRRKLALVGIMLSLCIAVSIVFIAEFLDTSFHTVEELRAFSRAPVLVRLPYVITAAEARRKRWQYGFVTIAMLLGLALIVISAYVTIKGLEELGTLWVQVQQLLQTVRELRSG
jgi:DNA-binding transcriptional regulator YbjK